LAAEEELGKRAEVELTEEDSRYIATLTLPETAEFFHEHFGLGNSADEVLQLISALMQKAYAEHVFAKPGALEYVRLLHKRGVKCSVASSTPKDLLEIGLSATGFMPYLEAVVSVDDVGASKRESDVYDKALELMGTEKNTTWVFEDAEYALITLIEAGYSTVAVYDNDLSGTLEELAIADKMILSFEELVPRKKFRILPIILIIALLALGGVVSWFAFHLYTHNSTGKEALLKTYEHSSPQEIEFTPPKEEQRLLDAVRAGVDANDPHIQFLPSPLIASYQDLQMHSPIVPKDLTEIEFHQASYDTALVLTPLVDIVEADLVSANHGTNRIPFEDQPVGSEPMIAEAVSTYRENSKGELFTSIDVGGKADTVVYAPITGTVVKAQPYLLYGFYDDYEIHIQSPDHPELDIVLLHIQNAKVKVGDKVIGGCTRIAYVRDLGYEMGNNLQNFTKPGDPGNHVHMQVNDATRKDYRGLEGALDIFDGHGYARPAPAPAPAPAAAAPASAGQS